MINTVVTIDQNCSKTLLTFTQVLRAAKTGITPVTTDNLHAILNSLKI